MTIKRFRTIESIAADLQWMRGPLISALVNCLDAQELAEGLERVPGRPGVLRRAIMRALSRDSHRLAAVQGHVLGSLLEQFQQSDYRTARASAYVLCEVASLDIPPNNRRRILSTLLDSRFTQVRASVYKVVRQSPDDPALIPVIESVWRRFGDTQCASLIVDKMPLEFLLAEFDKLDSALVGFLPKARLYIRVAEKDPSVVERLQRDDEVAWTYIKVKLGHPPLASEEALALFWRNELHSELALLLWCFGQMGLWEVLVEIASKRDYFKSLEYHEKGYKISLSRLTEMNTKPPA
ncbi:MAG: hypothetical protein HW388_1286 [Dehalococcoidia bacterium]|nr:hypothetical protein [Dehalococcoidia bacterium]